MEPSGFPYTPQMSSRQSPTAGPSTNVVNIEHAARLPPFVTERRPSNQRTPSASNNQEVVIDKKQLDWLYERVMRRIEDSNRLESRIHNELLRRDMEAVMMSIGTPVSKHSSRQPSPAAQESGLPPIPDQESVEEVHATILGSSMDSDTRGVEEGIQRVEQMVQNMHDSLSAPLEILDQGVQEALARTRSTRLSRAGFETEPTQPTGQQGYQSTLR